MVVVIVVVIVVVVVIIVCASNYSYSAAVRSGRFLYVWENHCPRLAVLLR